MFTYQAPAVHHQPNQDMAAAVAPAMLPPRQPGALPLWLTPDEIEYLMGLCLTSPNNCATEDALLQRLVALWRQFAQK